MIEDKIFVPTGHSILIKIHSPDEKKVGSIVLADAEDLVINKDTNNHSFERNIEKKSMQQYTGVVVALGETAYYDKAAPWCKVGDEVYFITHGARAMHDEGWYGSNDLLDKRPPSLRQVFDLDITGVFKERTEVKI